MTAVGSKILARYFHKPLDFRAVKEYNILADEMMLRK